MVTAGPLDITEPAEAHSLARAAAIAGAVPDPEIPAVTVVDLGILRSVTDDTGTIVVRLTPTYTGCPAVLAIELAVEAALRDAGFDDVRIERVLAPAWSTDDITAAGRDKLRAYGIAPPERKAGRGSLLFEAEAVTCPRCGSRNTTCAATTAASRSTPSSACDRPCMTTNR